MNGLGCAQIPRRFLFYQRGEARGEEVRGGLARGGVPRAQTAGADVRGEERSVEERRGGALGLRQRQ